MLFTEDFEIFLKKIKKKHFEKFSCTIFFLVIFFAVTIWSCRKTEFLDTAASFLENYLVKWSLRR